MKKYFFVTSFFVFLFLFCFNVFAFEDEYIVRLKDNADILLFSDDAQVLSDELKIYKVNGKDASLLQKSNNVLSIEKNQEVILFDNDYNDELFNQQYYFEMMNITEAKKNIVQNGKTKIAVIDSGIYKYHKDLINADIQEGFNYITKDNDTIDVDNHGTRVAGVIAATENNEIGIAGINNNVTIVPLVVSYNDKGTAADVIQAMEDAVNIYDCKILQMSLGVLNYSQIMQDVVNNIVEKGAIIIAAAGNRGNSTLYYPAGCNNVIGVGSVGLAYSVSTFSEKNESVDVVAVGEAMYLPNIDGEYTVSRGTSFSCPVVSGIVSLLLNQYPSLNYYDVFEAIKASSADLGDSGYDIKYGYGLVDSNDLFNFKKDNNSFYISPVKQLGNGFNIKVYSNDSESAVILFNVYDENGYFIESIKNDIVIEDNIYCLNVKYDKISDKKFNIMVIKSLESIKPLASLKII